MNEAFDLSGERALVTGAGRGVGRSIAEALARQGASVGVVARSRTEVDAAAKAIVADGGTAAATTADVSDSDSVAALVDWSSSALGGPVTVLVNNAGVYIPNRFLDYDEADWQRILDVNVLGVVRTTAAFLPQMLTDQRGRIINIASTAGRWGSANQSAYNVSKHAVVGLTRCLALETAASGVRVNAICPGFVDTELIFESPLGRIMGMETDELRDHVAHRAPIGRMVTPEEVAHLVVYLASPGADAVTGVGLTIAGGLIFT